MTLKEALKRIEALEAEVARLKSLPRQEYHYHYHPMHQPWYPPMSVPTVWMGGAGVGGAVSTTKAISGSAGTSISF